jgi:hypothetical protein
MRFKKLSEENIVSSHAEVNFVRIAVYKGDIV